MKMMKLMNEMAMLKKDQEEKNIELAKLSAQNAEIQAKYESEIEDLKTELQAVIVKDVETTMKLMTKMDMLNNKLEEKDINFANLLAQFVESKAKYESEFETKTELQAVIVKETEAHKNTDDRLSLKLAAEKVAHQQANYHLSAQKKKNAETNGKYELVIADMVMLEGDKKAKLEELTKVQSALAKSQRELQESQQKEKVLRLELEKMR